MRQSSISPSRKTGQRVFRCTNASRANGPCKGIVYFEVSRGGVGRQGLTLPAVRWFPSPERTRRRAAARDPGSARTGVGVCGVSRVRAWDVARSLSLREGVLGQPSAWRPPAMSPHTKKSHHAQWTPSTHTRTLCAPR